MIKERFKFYFQNSCNDTAVDTFTADSNGGKQRFTVTGYTVSDYFDVGDEMEFIYDGAVFLYTIIGITGNAITMSFDYNSDIDNTNTTLQFSPKIECFPNEFYKGKFEYKLVDGQMFYRMAYKGEVVFTDADFEYLRDNVLNQTCCQVNLKIYKLCEGEYNLYYRSVVKGNLGKWDLSQCTFKSDLPAIDKYDCMIASMGNEYNILSDPDINNTLELAYLDLENSGSDRPYHEFYVRATAPVAPGDTYDVGDGGALFEQVDGTGGFVSDPNTGNPWTLYVRTARYYLYDGDFNFTPPTLSGLTLTETTYSNGKVLAKYTSNAINTDRPEISLVLYGTGGNCEYDQNYFAIYDPVNDNCIWVTYPQIVTSKTFRGRQLDYVLGRLTESVCNSISGINSDFFEINPVGDSPGYVAGQNYVTGTINYVKYIGISDIYDVLNSTSDPSTVLELSFKFISETLNKMFDVYWHIDANYQVRFEHILWYEQANLLIDLTASPYDQYNRNKQAFTYLKDETPRRERFTFENSMNVDFKGTDIVYDNGCSNDNTKIYNCSAVTTDINYLMSYPADKFSSSGIVMFVYVPGVGTPPNGVIIDEPGLITGLSIPNNHLSWANLQYNYHRYGRPLINGNMNFIDETFLSAIKRRKLSTQKIVNCCIDMTGTLANITTELGVSDATILTENLQSNIIDLELNV